ncbi:hypothetical protein AAVH_41250, partial [Aphelenchoides avenae]
MRCAVTVLVLAAVPVTLSLKCYGALYYDYSDSDMELSTCHKSAKSCTSSYKPNDSEYNSDYLSNSESLKQACSDEPCMLDGKVVKHAVCFNTTDGHEECCCYGDGCNENYRMQHFLDK